MVRTTGRFLLAMFGVGVVLVVFGWWAGWEQDGKGRGPAASGGIILACWVVLQAWHTTRSTRAAPPEEPEDEAGAV